MLFIFLQNTYTLPHKIKAMRNKQRSLSLTQNYLLNKLERVPTAEDILTSLPAGVAQQYRFQKIAESAA